MVDWIYDCIFCTYWLFNSDFGLKTGNLYSEFGWVILVKLAMILSFF